MIHRLFKGLFKKPADKKPDRRTRIDKHQPAENMRAYRAEELKAIPVSFRLNDNLDRLQIILGRNKDIIIRRFKLGLDDRTEAALVHLDGMVNPLLLSNDVLKPLMLESREAGFKSPRGSRLELVKSTVLNVSVVEDAVNIEEMVSGILCGKAALMIDGEESALILGIKGWATRDISEPQSEIVLRGPREGFTEDIITNVTLLRRKLKSPNLVLENIRLGRITDTRIAVSYLRSIVSPDLVAEVKSRLERIDIDGVLESGYLEEFIEDNPYSPFPQVLNTERPDIAASALLEGRVAIFTDGTPSCLIVPAQLAFFIQSPDDYYQRFLYTTAVRWVRYTALFVSLLLPSLYIAISTFHQEMIPTELLISISAAREGVPIPALLEALLMELTFEALREAGLRLPRQVGQAISIVGALVIGQAGVQAGLVSPLMVIVVATTGITSFIVPVFNFGFALRLLRFPVMLLAATLGLFGVMVGVLAILIHLAGLRSFGAPYLAPLTPLYTEGLQDVAVRAPWWAMNKRPQGTAKLNRRRQKPGLKPTPPDPGREKRKDKDEAGKWH